MKRASIRQWEPFFKYSYEGQLREYFMQFASEILVYFQKERVACHENAQMDFIGFMGTILGCY